MRCTVAAAKAVTVGRQLRRHCLAWDDHAICTNARLCRSRSSLAVQMQRLKVDDVRQDLQAGEAHTQSLKLDADTEA